MYGKYITPYDDKVKQIAEQIDNEAKSLKEGYDIPISLIKACLALEWTKRNLRLVPSNLSLPNETIKRKMGSCFCQATVLCSLLRALGFSDQDVFVVIRHTDKSFQIRFHAEVILRSPFDSHRWFVLDTEERSVWSHQANEQALQNAIYMFNDKVEKRIGFHKKT